MATYSSDSYSDGEGTDTDLTLGAELSWATTNTRLIELVTADRVRVTCKIQYLIMSDITKPRVNTPPELIQIEYVNRCRVFCRHKTVTELEEANVCAETPVATYSLPGINQVTCSIAITPSDRKSISSSLWAKLMKGINPSTSTHALMIYTRDDDLFSVKFHITSSLKGSARQDLIDRIIDAHVVLFWSRTKWEIERDYEEGLIPIRSSHQPCKLEFVKRSSWLLW